MATIGTFEIGREGLGSTLLRDPPSVTFNAPTSVIQGDTVTVDWTYFSQLGRAQASYRVYLSSGSLDVLFDSGDIAGTDSTFVVPFTLQPFATYLVGVIVSDGIDTNGLLGQLKSFSTEAFGAPNFPDEQAVGSVYEIAINGRGYMLADHPEQGSNRRSQAVQLEPERLVTGDTPFSESINRYSFISQDDWSGGAGQKFRDKPRSDLSRYRYSQGIDPFTEPGEIRALPRLTRHIADTYVTQIATVASGSVYVLTEDTELTARDAPGGTNTAFNPGLTGTIFDLASDGDNWYATNGSAIRRNTSPAAPAGDWSTVSVTEIEWIGDRLAGIDGFAATQNFTTFDSAGAEEVAGGRFLFPDAELKGITAGDGFVWFGVNRSDSATVHAWQVDSPDSEFIALTLPFGEVVAGLFFYLGNVMLGTVTSGAGAGDGVLKFYRCVPAEGRLTPEFITQTAPQLETRAHFAGHDRFVAFGWPGMIDVAGYSGIGVFDLETGGFARWFSSDNVNGRIQAVVTWDHEFGFTIREDGFYGLSTSVLYGQPAAAELPLVRGSVSDLGSNIVKSIDQLLVSTEPLLDDSSVDIALSTDSGESFNDIGTQSGAGSTGIQLDTTLAGNDMSYELLLNPSTDRTKTPVVRHVGIKAHPFGLFDRVLQLTVNCGEKMKGVFGQPLVGPGLAGARELAALAGQNVQLQDVDWPITQQTEIWQVVAAEVQSAGVPDPVKGRRAEAGTTCVITLRKPG